MHRIKRGSSFLIRRTSDLTHPLWERRYFDRPVVSESQLRSTVRYVEGNPVRAGLAEEASEFPFSSASPQWDTDLAAYLNGELAWLEGSRDAS